MASKDEIDRKIIDFFDKFEASEEGLDQNARELCRIFEELLESKIIDSDHDKNQLFEWTNNLTLYSRDVKNLRKKEKVGQLPDKTMLEQKEGFIVAIINTFKFSEIRKSVRPSANAASLHARPNDTDVRNAIDIRNESEITRQYEEALYVISMAEKSGQLIEVVTRSGITIRSVSAAAPSGAGSPQPQGAHPGGGIVAATQVVRPH